MLRLTIRRSKKIFAAEIVSLVSSEERTACAACRRRYLRLWETETGRYTELKKDDLLRNSRIEMPDLIEHPKPPKEAPKAPPEGSQSGG